MQARPGFGRARADVARMGRLAALLVLGSCSGAASAASARAAGEAACATRSGWDASSLLQTSTGTVAGRGEALLPASTWSWRQELRNFEDTQYVANVTLGGQVISGIIDTGSFELVVFEADCVGCGVAGRYNASSSATRAQGMLSRGLFYGSGDVYAKEAFDQLAIGPFPVLTQSFWQVYQATMNILQTAHFQAIIGIGPSQMPRAEAWQDVAVSVEDVRETAEEGRRPTQMQSDMVKMRMGFYKEITRTPTMVDAFHISTFSLCLLNEPGAPGYFVWNDSVPFEQPGLFRRISVMGRHTWTVNMTSVHLNPRSAGPEPVLVGCSEGCGAIVDSGTSLLMMPADSVRQLEQNLKGMGAFNCSNLEEMPDIVFRLDGELFSLPPDAYLAEEVTDVPSYMAGFVRMHVLDVSDSHRCKLSVMESYSTTHWGPLWILGMPFFRRYYTTFDVGRTRSGRSLLVAPANAECAPEADANGASLQRSSNRQVYRRRISMSDVYVSPLVRKALQPGKVVDL